MVKKWAFAVLAACCGISLAATAAAREEVEVGFPAAGTELTFEKRIGDKTDTIKWISVDITQYKGRAVNRLISDRGFEFYDVETKSWIATMLDGKLKEVTPHNGQLSPTLWVGKSWSAEHLYTRRDGSQAQQQRTWTVEARETVEVPAGSFDTLRIKSEGKSLTITLWYAPALNFYVKRLTEGVMHIEQQLLAVKAP